MIIKLLTKQEEKEWDEFAERHTGCRFSFLTGYKKVVEKSFGYYSRYFIFEKNNQIAGVFPCFLAGNKLISIPFGVYGGLLGYFEDFQNRLELKEIFEQIKREFPQVVIFGEKNKFLADSFYEVKTQSFGVLELMDEKAMWDSFDYAVRKNVNKAGSLGIEVVEDNSKEAIKNWFYPLYLKEMKMFGTPPYPLRFFLAFNEFLGEKLKVFFAKDKQGKIIASLFGIGGGDIFYIHFNPSLVKYRAQRPNDLLHWEMIKQAYRDEYKYFDFGPMRYLGQTRFKEKWGVQKKDYYFYSTQEIGKNGEGQFQKIASWAWKYFMPNFLAKEIGPIIRKKLVK